MAAEVTPSAMRRKAGVGRPPPDIGALTPGKALRGAVAQAAQEVAGLVAVAGTAEDGPTTLGQMVEGFPEQPLIGLIGAPDGRLGLVVLDIQVVAALIEIQTTGQVAGRPATPRRPTRTDAIMCADFIVRALALLSERIEEGGLDDAPALTGFGYMMALPDPRAVAMTLEDLAYRQFSLPVDLAQGAKSGQIRVILPAKISAGPAGRAGAAGFSQALRRRVMAARTQLSATLARHEMPLAALTGLAVGDLVPLPRAGLDAVAVEDLRGRVVAHGRLGQTDGHRAVRLRAVDDPDRPGDANAPPAVPPAAPAQIAPPAAAAAAAAGTAPAPDGALQTGALEGALPEIGELADLADLND